MVKEHVRTIAELRADLQLETDPEKRRYISSIIAAAKPVRVSRAADVLEDYELEYIRHVLKPKVRQCYRNAFLLCEAFPERISYCEGFINAPITIRHAFNKIGGDYVDITIEFALGEPPEAFEYVECGEYGLEEITAAAKGSGHYGYVFDWYYGHRE